MKRSILVMFVLVGIAFLHQACSDEGYDDYAYDEPTIYSTSGKVALTEVILFVSPYIVSNGQRQYIVVDRLYNLSLKVNQKSRKPTDSYVMDTLRLSGKGTAGGYRVIEQKLQYAFAVNVRNTDGGLTTAGQYANLLNNYLNLPPGNYICQIESFDIKNAVGALQKIYTPALICPLTVGENQASVNLGHFEIAIKE